MATLTGQLVAETYKALLKTINNDVMTASEVQISDGFGQGTNVFLDQNGFVRASKYKVTGGTSSQFLKANGTLDSTSYLPSGTTTTSIPEGTNQYFTQIRVLNSNLAGFTPISGSVSSSDSVLTALEKIWWNIINGGGGGGGGYVPYVGATQDLNLGEWGLKAGNVQYDTTPTNIPTAQGSTYWDTDHSTIKIVMNGFLQRVGEDLVYPVKNQTGITIPKGTAVGFAGTLGSSGRLLIAPFLADGTYPSSYFMGIAGEDIIDGADGFVLSFGQIRQYNTTAFLDEDILYVSPTTAGALTATKPIAPNNIIQVAAVVKSATNGTLQIRVTLGSNLADDEMVYLNPATLIDNNILVYDDANSRFTNRNIFHTQGYVPVYDATSLLIDSPIFTDGSQIGIGTESFIGTNLVTIQGGIWGEELTLNDNLLLHTNTLSGNAFMSRWSGTMWDVMQTFYSDHILFSKDIESTKFTKTGGLGSQFLMANGSTATTSSLNILTGPGNQNYIGKFNNASGNEMFDSQLYDNGTNIGLGTTSPFKKFTVIGAISTYSSSTNYGFMDTSNNSFTLTSANGFNFTANNLGTVATTRVETNGNWGFGIGTPTYKVDVNGDVNITTGSSYRINGSAITTSNIAEGTNLYFTSNRVLGQVLTGLNTSLTGLVTSADSLIVGISKLQNQISSVVSGVSSVFGRTGAVVAVSGDYNTSQVTESTNLYYTDARARASVSAGTGISYNSTTGVIASTITQYTDALARASLSFVAGSGAYNSTTGVITIPTNTNQLTNGASFITLSSLSGGSGITYNNTTGVISYSGTIYTDSSIRALFSAGSGISYNNTTGVIASTITQYTDAMARASLSFTAGSGAYNSTTGVITIPTNTSQLTNGANFITLASLSASSPLSYNSGTGAFSISVAGAAQNGYLTAVDWNTFNSKQPLLTNPITGTGTANYVPKFNGTTSLTNSLIYDNGTNIGIGTISPGYKLQVNGDVGFFSASGSLNGIITQGAEGKGRLYIYDGGNATIGLQTNGSSYFNAGNVGIGTSSPSYKLDVVGTGNFTGELFVRGNNSAYTTHTFTTGASNVALYDQLNASGTTINRINAGGDSYIKGGNLGLGVTPSAFESGFNVFQIGNTGVLANNTSDLRIILNSNSYNNSAGTTTYLANGYASSYMQISGTHRWYTAPSGTAGTAISFTQAMTLDASGNLLVGATSNNGGVRLYSSNGSNGLPVTSGTTQTYGALRLRGGDNAVLDFGLNSTNTWIQATDLSNLANTYNILLNPRGGNVGIGTTSPSYKTHIYGSSDNQLAIDGSGRFTSMYLLNSGSVKGGVSYDNNTDNYQIAYIPGTNTYASIYTQGSERMRINAGGNVSIGNTNNTYKLDVSGTGMRLLNVGASVDFILDRANTSSGAAINLNTNGTNKWFFGLRGLVDDNMYFFSQGASANVLTLNYSSGAATFSSSVTAGSNISINTNATSFQWTNAGNNVALNATSGDLNIYTGTSGYTQKMIVTSTGNVGIGTASPSGKLDIVGGLLYINNATASTAKPIMVWNTTGSNYGSWYDVGANNNKIAFGGTSTISGIPSSPTITLDYTNNYVGIGTTSPAEKLEVNGNIKINNGLADGGQLVLASSGYSDWNIDSYSGNLRAYYGSTEYLRLTSNGDLGLGSIPTAVSGYRVLTIQGGSGSILDLKYSSTQYGRVYAESNAVGFNAFESNLYIGMVASSNYLNILFGDKTTGYVGIRRTSANYALDVAGDVNISGTFRINGTPIGTGGGGVSGSGTTNYIPMWSSGTSLTNSGMRMNYTTLLISGEVEIGGTYLSVGAISNANKINIARPSDGNTSATYVGYHSASNTDFGIANNSGSGEVIIKANSYNAMKVRWNTIELPNLASGSTGRALMELYYDANGFVKIKL